MSLLFPEISCRCIPERSQRRCSLSYTLFPGIMHNFCSFYSRGSGKYLCVKRGSTRRIPGVFFAVLRGLGIRCVAVSSPKTRTDGNIPRSSSCRRGAFSNVLVISRYIALLPCPMSIGARYQTSSSRRSSPNHEVSHPTTVKFVKKNSGLMSVNLHVIFWVSCT